MAKHGKGGGKGADAGAAGCKKGSAASGAGPAAGAGAGASGSSGITTGGSGAGAYTLEIREGCVALMRFRTRDGMNALLDPISNAMEGVIANRLGHNFALSDSDRQHQAFRKTCGLPKTVRYVIATLEGDAHSIRHEMCHARYYLDPPYRTTVSQVWESALTPQQREAVCAFLTRLKYDPCVHEDEWQAYLVTEKSNFFGMDLAEAQQQLAAAFPPGSWR
ncbi:hypothetical protein HYH02_003456 [Chlamydomonas schloesseri]|uniref:Uncharacterized protein n=1 Tax=Chlamydomonas schloesseri TaxID=2026947 RepID=A0A835WQC0_9CHLO|nr:hypothetical protein HYH02_003456 [Chlamydomonas schloesseri]|eukprot:KAG2451676.1 hypothetical protein HYH02_003456 [Chlamydomonas schloesseri]